MDLNEWIWRNKLTQTSVSKMTGIHHQTIHNLIKRKNSPCMFNAFALKKFTNNEVDFADMIAKDELEKLEKIQPFNPENQQV